ncbi:MAG: DNA polymerase III subunit gamma/tau [bacterium]|nr:DNA polymerase III subunit gamma/tau [bacterium]
MSFLVTARKWRPQTFAEVVGQESVSRTLQNALKAGRIAHAFIFAGPRGIGKTTTARLLAKAINCVNGPTANPCNQCIACKEIPEGRSLDVLEIDGASNRGVGEIRNLRDNIHFNPAALRKKIYIIDEVHMLTIEAFNALLKTLEEPPEHAIFIFATTEISRVPATILSRCQRFDFRRLSVQEIFSHLRHICDVEQVKADDEALELIARRADGAMRDAQSLLDQMTTFAPDGITVDEVRNALGMVPEDLFFRVSDLFLEKKPEAVFALVEEVDARGQSPREFLHSLLEHFLNFIKARNAQIAEFIEAPADVRKRYLDAAADFNINDLLRILAILQDAFTDIRRHPNPRLKLELTLLRLATLDRTAQIEELINEMRGENPPPGRESKPPTPAPREKTRTPAAATPAPTMPPPPSPNAASPDNPPAATMIKATMGGIIPLELGSIRSRWLELVDRVCEGRIPLACQIKLGHPQRLEDNTLVVGFGSDLHDMQLERLIKVAASGSLDAGLEVVFGSPARLRFERVTKSEAAELPRSVQDDDPLETELIRTLGAKRIA